MFITSLRAYSTKKGPLSAKNNCLLMRTTLDYVQIWIYGIANIIELHQRTSLFCTQNLDPSACFFYPGVIKTVRVMLGAKKPWHFDAGGTHIYLSQMLLAFQQWANMEEQLLYVMRRKLRNHSNLLELFITGIRLVSLFCHMEVETALLAKRIHSREPFH